MAGSGMSPARWLWFLIAAAVIIIAVLQPLLQGRGIHAGVGFNAHLGDMKASLGLEAFENDNAPVFVMFYADWCGACKQTKPVVERVADANASGKVKFKFLNGDDQANAAMMKKYNVNAYPTMMMFPAGLSSEPVPYSGGRTEDELNNFIRQYNN